MLLWTWTCQSECACVDVDGTYHNLDTDMMSCHRFIAKLCAAYVALAEPAALLGGPAATAQAQRPCWATAYPGRTCRCPGAIRGCEQPAPIRTHIKRNQNYLAIWPLQHSTEYDKMRCNDIVAAQF